MDKEQMDAAGARLTTNPNDLPLVDSWIAKGWLPSRSIPDPFYHLVPKVELESISTFEVVNAIGRCMRLATLPRAFIFQDPSFQSCADLRDELFARNRSDTQSKRLQREYVARKTFQYDPHSLPWRPRPEYLQILERQNRFSATSAGSVTHAFDLKNSVPREVLQETK